jgi:flavin reductase (DIM6/NTAB) family NADH-FMN oxidoreductase RutF
MEAVVEAVHPVADEDSLQRGGIVAVEVRVQRVFVHDDIRVPGSPDHIDPDAWRPLIMSFQKLYGLGSQVHPSTLARIPERLYRGPDIDRARSVSGSRG